jgi:diketogulonate reductase-like aldo/keto reductase
VERKDIWLTTKIWNTDHSSARVESAARKSMKLLRVDYLDALLIHWPVTGSRGDVLAPSVKETWQAMERLVDSGLVRHIGVSNFSIAKMDDVRAYARHPLSICQCECHPFFRNDAVVAYCQENNIHFTAFSPLGSPDSADIFRRSAPVLLEHSAVAAAAAAAGVNTGQALIKWALQCRPGCSVLPKSVCRQRILSNASMVGWQLPEHAMAALSAMPLQTRMVHGAMFLSPAGPYRTLTDLWDEEEAQAAGGPLAAA